MINISEELDWILAELSHGEYYLLESVVTIAKPYAVADVHEWGARREYNQKYEKIKDLIKVRVHEAMELERLDRTIGNGILQTYYYKPFAEEKEVAGGGLGEMSDGELEKMLGGMGWVRKGSEVVAKKKGGKK